MLHVQTEMLHAVGIPYLNRDARNMGEDFALTAQESVLATVQAAGGRLDPLKVSLLVQEVGLARQALMAIMSLIQQGDSRPLLVDDSSPVDLAKLEQMLDESELMREFKADIKEITGLHHELISVPEAQRIVRARQPVVDQIAREGLEPLELRPEEMSRFLEGGDRFYAERTLIDGRWVDLARISAKKAAEAEEERKKRQQEEVDRRIAELRAKARAEEEARQREAAEEKRKELLRSKQRVGTLTPGERDELQDMLDRDAAQRAAQHVDPYK